MRSSRDAECMDVFFFSLENLVLGYLHVEEFE